MRSAALALVAVLALGAAGCGPKVVIGSGKTSTSTAGGKRSKKSVPQLEEELAGARAREAKAIEERKAKERELKAARLARIQSRLHWITGIAVTVAVLCIVLAIFLPAFKKWAVYGALAAIAVAGLAWLAAWLVPYLIWIGVAVLIMFIGLAIYYWRLDHKSRDQIVEAIEDSRKDLDEKLPEIWDTFRKKIDTNSDTAIDWARKRLGKL